MIRWLPRAERPALHLAALLLLLVATAGRALAKVDLVTLPYRDSVELTIYNPADLTYVREARSLTLKKGENLLQFSWANTLIDPTSLEMFPKKFAESIGLLDLDYPPRVRNAGMFRIESKVAGDVPMELTYLTSGLSWRAVYTGTLSPDERTMHLSGFVRVANNSGEDYENAKVRLIVGKIALVDQIMDLARREAPYGRPEGPTPPPAPTLQYAPRPARQAKAAMAGAMAAAEKDEEWSRPREIEKEGLGEYYLYTIEGRDTIPTGWGKLLPSFEAADVPVVNLYKYEEERYGTSVIRFLSFRNDKEHKLGQTPIPDGDIRLFRAAGEAGDLAYEGASSFKYIPVDQEAELSLGAVANVIVKPVLMEFKTDRYLFDRTNDIVGWDEIRTFEIEVTNTRDVPVKVEITRNFSTNSWDLKDTDPEVTHKKVDKDTVKYVLTLAPGKSRKFGYVLTTHHGRRAQGG